MPSSAVRSFTDPDDYAAAVRHGAVDVTVTGRGQFAAQIIRVDLHRLWMQRFSDNLPRISHTNTPGKRTVISFPTQPIPSLIFNGVDLLPTNVIRHSEHSDFFLRSTLTTGMGYMSLTVEDMASVGAEIAGCDLGPPRDELILTSLPSAMTRLQRLHAAAGHLAETTPEIIAHPGAARGLEQALIEAMVGCLTAADTLEERSAQRRHERIMRRFHRTIAENPDEPLYIPEICKAIGVPGRTLRICCQEQLGMSPKHYLTQRRMHMARRDLSRANATATTVTEVAARYGFWQFGHFAGAYQSIFGELPSTTLVRPPG